MEKRIYTHNEVEIVVNKKLYISSQDILEAINKILGPSGVSFKIFDTSVKNALYNKVIIKTEVSIEISAAAFKALFELKSKLPKYVDYIYFYE